MAKGDSAEISYDVENFCKTPTVGRAETCLSRGMFFGNFSGLIIFRHDQGGSDKTLCHRKNWLNRFVRQSWTAPIRRAKLDEKILGGLGIFRGFRGIFA